MQKPLKAVKTTGATRKARVIDNPDQGGEAPSKASDSFQQNHHKHSTSHGKQSGVAFIVLPDPAAPDDDRPTPAPEKDDVTPAPPKVHKNLHVSFTGSSAVILTAVDTLTNTNSVVPAVHSLVGNHLVHFSDGEKRKPEEQLEPRPGTRKHPFRQEEMTKALAISSEVHRADFAQPPEKAEQAKSDDSLVIEHDDGAASKRDDRKDELLQDASATQIFPPPDAVKRAETVGVMESRPEVAVCFDQSDMDDGKAQAKLGVFRTSVSHRKASTQDDPHEKLMLPPQVETLLAALELPKVAPSTVRVNPAEAKASSLHVDGRKGSAAKGGSAKPPMPQKAVVPPKGKASHPADVAAIGASSMRVSTKKDRPVSGMGPEKPLTPVPPAAATDAATAVKGPAGSSEQPLVSEGETFKKKPEDRLYRKWEYYFDFASEEVAPEKELSGNGYDLAKGPTGLRSQFVEDEVNHAFFQKALGHLVSRWFRQSYLQQPNQRPDFCDNCFPDDVRHLRSTFLGIRDVLAPASNQYAVDTEEPEPYHGLMNATNVWRKQLDVAIKANLPKYDRGPSQFQVSFFNVNLPGFENTSATLRRTWREAFGKIGAAEHYKETPASAQKMVSSEEEVLRYYAPMCPAKDYGYDVRNDQIGDDFPPKRDPALVGGVLDDIFAQGDRNYQRYMQVQKKTSRKVFRPVKQPSMFELGLKSEKVPKKPRHLSVPVNAPNAAYRINLAQRLSGPLWPERFIPPRTGAKYTRPHYRATTKTWEARMKVQRGAAERRRHKPKRTARDFLTFVRNPEFSKRPSSGYLRKLRKAHHKGFCPRFQSMVPRIRLSQTYFQHPTRAKQRKMLRKRSVPEPKCLPVDLEKLPSQLRHGHNKGALWKLLRDEAQKHAAPMHPESQPGAMDTSEMRERTDSNHTHPHGSSTFSLSAGETRAAGFHEITLARVKSSSAVAVNRGTAASEASLSENACKLDLTRTSSNRLPGKFSDAMSTLQETFEDVEDDTIRQVKSTLRKKEDKELETRNHRAPREAKDPAYMRRRPGKVGQDHVVSVRSSETGGKFLCFAPGKDDLQENLAGCVQQYSQQNGTPTGGLQDAVMYCRMKYPDAFDVLHPASEKLSFPTIPKYDSMAGPCELIAQTTAGRPFPGKSFAHATGHSNRPMFPSLNKQQRHLAEKTPASTTGLQFLSHGNQTRGGLAQPTAIPASSDASCAGKFLCFSPAREDVGQLVSDCVRAFSGHQEIGAENLEEAITACRMKYPDAFEGPLPAAENSSPVQSVTSCGMPLCFVNATDDIGKKFSDCIQNLSAGNLHDTVMYCKMKYPDAFGSSFLGTQNLSTVPSDSACGKGLGCALAKEDIGKELSECAQKLSTGNLRDAIMYCRMKYPYAFGSSFTASEEPFGACDATKSGFVVRPAHGSLQEITGKPVTRTLVRPRRQLSYLANPNAPTASMLEVPSKAGGDSEQSSNKGPPGIIFPFAPVGSPTPTKCNTAFFYKNPVVKPKRPISKLDRNYGLQAKPSLRNHQARLLHFANETLYGPTFLPKPCDHDPARDSRFWRQKPPFVVALKTKLGRPILSDTKRFLKSIQNARERGLEGILKNFTVTEGIKPLLRMRTPQDAEQEAALGRTIRSNDLNSVRMVLRQKRLQRLLRVFETKDVRAENHVGFIADSQQQKESRLMESVALVAERKAQFVRPQLNVQQQALWNHVQEERYQLNLAKVMRRLTGIYRISHIKRSAMKHELNLHAVETQAARTEDTKLVLPVSAEASSEFSDSESKTAANRTKTGGRKGSASKNTRREEAVAAANIDDPKGQNTGPPLTIKPAVEKASRLKTSTGAKDRKQMLNAELTNKPTEVQSIGFVPGTSTTGSNPDRGPTEAKSTEGNALAALKQKFEVLPLDSDEVPWWNFRPEDQFPRPISSAGPASHDRFCPAHFCLQQESKEAAYDTPIPTLLEKFKQRLSKDPAFAKFTLHQYTAVPSVDYEEGKKNEDNHVETHLEKDQWTEEALVVRTGICTTLTLDDYAWQLPEIVRQERAVQKRLRYYDACIEYLMSLMPETGSQVVLAKLEQLHMLPSSDNGSVVKPSREQRIQHLAEALDNLSCVLSLDPDSESDEHFRKKLLGRILRLELAKLQLRQQADAITTRHQILHVQKMVAKWPRFTKGYSVVSPFIPVASRPRFARTPPPSPPRRLSPHRPKTEPDLVATDDEGGGKKGKGERKGEKDKGKKGKSDEQSAVKVHGKKVSTSHTAVAKK